MSDKNINNNKIIIILAIEIMTVINMMMINNKNNLIFLEMIGYYSIIVLGNSSLGLMRNFGRLDFQPTFRLTHRTKADFI